MKYFNLSVTKSVVTEVYIAAPDTMTEAGITHQMMVDAIAHEGYNLEWESESMYPDYGIQDVEEVESEDALQYSVFTLPGAAEADAAAAMEARDIPGQMDLFGEVPL